ncbi:MULTISPECIES: Mth938-like domain-containing protein [Xanthomonas]|uniref:Mth938-like domain-containing protein n=1 Tax=Xanthomonas hawaiiensis TaxID=3003247 RepID=A0ABU2HZX5_9XANT|nr:MULTISPECIES: Mth938-like domain-containing protein [unclassified Xanthomonas]MCC4590971.1 Mth938-like domain-containing protein [Xanthomonas campestris pv. cannae]MBO9828033.1 Mth938-like domain-containing protein [Xanthomonas sp. A2111]MBO9871803.1 Mth938-like domain-containing protein [Xanthomonas sp. D-93]MBO9882143.1 Mth938-like domain-containing protein [Xanthomonas sp. D-109]MDS9991453.1 Mth938-like domain-containing protein [Xanthomonas sp. A2111]
MQLTQDLPDYAYALRMADGRQAKVNDRLLTRSFILAPDTLVEDWQAPLAGDLQPQHLQPLLDLNPALVILGTGERQVFPAAAVMALFLTRGIGIEVMNNAAAARTYNVLAAEGRRVAVGFLLEG